MLKKMLIAAVAVVAAGVAAPAQSKVQLSKIKLPPGFQISVWAEGVANVRSLTQSPGGTVFAGTWNAGNVYALRDENKDGKADRVITVISGLRNMPNGVAFRDGALYLAEINRVVRFDNIESKLEKAGTPVVVTEKLPSDRHHGWKFIRFGPDGLLYVPVGAPCNMCDRGDPYAAILRMKPDGSGQEVFARGVRNTVGFDWHPTTQELWFTDNGRDNLGDNTPGDELNRVPKPGMHFGYPYCHEGTIVDPEFGGQAPVQRVRAAGTASGAARGRDWHALLHGLAVSAAVSQSDLHRRARLMEPQRVDTIHWQSHRHRTPAGEQGYGVRALRDGMAGRPQSMGTPCRFGSDAGWIDAGVGRHGGSDLQDYLRRQVIGT